MVIEEHLAIAEALDRGSAVDAAAALGTHLDLIFILFEELPDDRRRQFEP